MNLFERNIPGTGSPVIGTGFTVPTKQQMPVVESTDQPLNNELESLVESLIKQGYNRKLATTIAERKLSKKNTTPESQAVDTSTQTELKKESAFGKIGSAALKGIGSAIKSTGETVQNITGGAIAQAPEIIGDVGSFVTSGGGLFENTISESIKSAGKTGSEFVKKYGVYAPESTGAKVGGFGAELASTALTPGGIIGVASKGGKIAKGLEAFGQGVIDTAKLSAISSGELPTIGEAVAGGAFGLASKGAGSLLEYASQRLPSVGLKGAVNVGQRLEKSNIDEYKDTRNLSKWLNNKSQEGYNVSGTADTRLEGFKKIVSDGIKRNESQVKGLKVKPDIETQGSIQRALRVVADKMKVADVSKNMRSEISEFMALSKKSVLDAEDVFKARKLLGDENLFTKSGLTSEDLSKKGLINAWKKAGDWLDDNVKGFRDTNKDVEVAIALGKGLRESVRTGGQSGILTTSQLANLLSMPAVSSSIGTASDKLLKTTKRLLKSRELPDKLKKSPTK